MEAGQFLGAGSGNKLRDDRKQAGGFSMYFGLGYLSGHFEDIYPSNVVTFVTTDCVVMYLNVSE